MLVNMPMDEQRWIVFVDEPSETLEPGVAEIVAIMDITRRCMGDDDIHPFPPPHRRAQSPDDGPHLPFGILIRAAIVPDRTFQSENIQAAVPCEPAVQVDTTPGGVVLKRMSWLPQT